MGRLKYFLLLILEFEFLNMYVPTFNVTPQIKTLGSYNAKETESYNSCLHSNGRISKLV